MMLATLTDLEERYGDLPLVLEGPASLEFTFDDEQARAAVAG